MQAVVRNMIILQTLLPHVEHGKVVSLLDNGIKKCHICYMDSHFLGDNRRSKAGIPETFLLRKERQKEGKNEHRPHPDTHPFSSIQLCPSL